VTASDSAAHALEALPSRYFERVGGRHGVRRLVRAFYRRMEHEPEAAKLLDMHSNLERARERLELFLSEWLGGPQNYSRERGKRSLRARHLFFRVGGGERDAWLRCMRGALGDTVSDPHLRQELETAFLRQAQALVNREN
jgi:hemoglobin